MLSTPIWRKVTYEPSDVALPSRACSLRPRAGQEPPAPALPAEIVIRGREPGCWRRSEHQTRRRWDSPCGDGVLSRVVRRAVGACPDCKARGDSQ